MKSKVETIELNCEVCGRNFLLSKSDQSIRALRDGAMPQLCPLCRKDQREQQEKEKAQKQWEADQKQREREYAEFLERLKDWPTTTIEQLHLSGEKTLFILGNGFDLMHRVPSSYYAFRDTLGKRSQLRYALEDYIDVDDIWADFEYALAHFNIQGMCNPLVADTSLEMSGFYDDDPGAAEYYMAIEGIVWPLQVVVSELPSRFRKWIETLSVGTADRPLQSLFQGGKVLCFNYTEFVEQLYNVPKEEVCYIHGCRRKRKGHPKETLVLGHLPQESDDAFSINIQGKWMPKHPGKRALIEMVLDEAVQLAMQCDEALMKNCQENIKKHRAFFDGLSDIEEIVCIGHSFAPVDLDYFSEIIRTHASPKEIRWRFGCFGLRDLINLTNMVKILGLDRDQVQVFRTDEIRTLPMQDVAPPPAKPIVREDRLAASTDGKWLAMRKGNVLLIKDGGGKVFHEVVFSDAFSDAYFSPSGDVLLVHGFSLDSGIYLFRQIEGRWCFIRELEGIPNQGLMNRRLQRIMLDQNELLFVFNSRIRRYSLQTGEMLLNRAVQRANEKAYEGKNILQFLWKRRRC